MDVSSDSVLVKFEKESVVWYGVKSLGKIHDYEIGLSDHRECGRILG